ncbi:MAG: hypothetical protein AVDCRST_MAG11-318 [uncultured Gemmatimonadaceae bacterium]|uniref:Uncharacterized protein n=1 Tax=uncultured Gemmatimonadaceae bacterium TaxID=246130 RepID=A0A6J4K2F9_9BACT|nr:MAG: hypothetical protein AVDCRST_MAG11-318 [uncultured Gemmatimonadaceae bacterium]
MRPRRGGRTAAAPRARVARRLLFRPGAVIAAARANNKHRATPLRRSSNLGPPRRGRRRPA